MKKIHYAAIGMAAFALLAAIAAYYILSALSPPVSEYHAHANFAVYLNGTQFNFSQEKFMSSGQAPSNPYFHLHDMDGGVLHQHFPNLTLGYFFKTIKMEFASACFKTDSNASFCNDGGSRLRMYVQRANGTMMPNPQFENYVFEDLDRILIIYGNDSQALADTVFAKVPDNACIYSNKCPERGLPPNETSSCTSDSDYCGD